MFDIGWQEFILIALVAVVVVGPKDLPRAIRTVGQWIRKARSLASEFQGSLEEMAREAELDDVRKQIQQASREGVGASIEKHIDPGGDIRRSFEDAREASGADEIEGEVDEARRGASSLVASTGDTPVAAAGEDDGLGSYEALAAKSRIPDNSVKPPPPAATAPVEAKPREVKDTTAPAPSPAGPAPAGEKTAEDKSAQPAPDRRTAGEAGGA